MSTEINYNPYDTSHVLDFVVQNFAHKPACPMPPIKKIQWEPIFTELEAMKPMPMHKYREIVQHMAFLERQEKKAAQKKPLPPIPTDEELGAFGL